MGTLFQRCRQPIGTADLVLAGGVAIAGNAFCVPLLVRRLGSGVLAHVTLSALAATCLLEAIGSHLLGRQLLLALVLPARELLANCAEVHLCN